MHTTDPEPATSATADSSRSVSLLAIYAFVGANAIWILLMPWVRPIAESSMRRFSLTTPSFALWAIQQPTPAMYNFANIYEVHQWPPGLEASLLISPLGLDEAPSLGLIHRDHINHYPSRVLTFANLRKACCEPNRDRWLITHCHYRGWHIETTTEVKANGDGQFTVTRVEEPQR